MTETPTKSLSLEPEITDEEAISKTVPEIFQNRGNRTLTDIVFLIIQSLYFILVLTLVVICAANGDVNRIRKGYDSCGNICGVNNVADPNDVCPKEDHSDKEYNLIQSVEGYPRHCVLECPRNSSYVVLYNKCLPKEKRKEVLRFPFYEYTYEHFDGDMNLCFGHIIACVLIAVVFSFLMISCFFFFPNITTSFVVLISPLIVTAFCIFFWICYYSSYSTHFDEKTDNKVMLTISIIYLIISAGLLISMRYLSRKMSIANQVVKEACKMLTNQPILFLIPYMTFLAHILSIVIILFMYITIASSGPLVEIKEGVFMYKMSTLAYSTVILHTIGVVWFIVFLNHCEYMLLCIATSKCFFRREKGRVRNLLKDSLMILIRYHLGTLAFGSLVIDISEVMKTSVRKSAGQIKEGNGVVAKLTMCVMGGTCEIVARSIIYATRASYCETAIHGYPLCKAGKRAFQITNRNRLNVSAIVMVYRTVNVMATIFVVTLVCVIAYLILLHVENLYSLFAPLCVVFILSGMITGMLLRVFGTVIEVLLICYCEDLRENDGNSKPYFTGTSFLDLVDASRNYLPSPTMLTS